MAKINLSKISRRAIFKAAPPARVAPKASATVANDAKDGEGIENLREIIFGSMMEKYEEEIARLENRVAMEATSIRAEIAELGRTLENRVSEIDTGCSQAESVIREQILDQSNQLTEAIQECSERAIALMNAGVQEIRDQKIDRTTFANFLVNLGAHLDHDGSQKQAAAKN